MITHGRNVAGSASNRTIGLGAMAGSSSSWVSSAHWISLNDHLAGNLAGVYQVTYPVSHLTLGYACTIGDRKMVAMMIARGDDLNQIDELGRSPLFTACLRGQAEIVPMLLAAGAEIDQATVAGLTPLHLACDHGYNDIASMLLAAGAAVNQVDNNGHTPLLGPCMRGHLATVQLLSSYGANRQCHPSPTCSAEAMAALVRPFESRMALLVWLVESRQWCTPLHHLSIVGVDRARSLLRAGADLHAAAVPGGPTPLSLARAMDVAGEVADGSTAHLVLEAAKPWSEATHALFPEAARAQAVELLRLGHLLSRQERFNRQETAFFDLWMGWVVPHAVTR